MAGVGGKRRLLSGGTELRSRAFYVYFRVFVLRIVIFSMVAIVSAWGWGRGFTRRRDEFPSWYWCVFDLRIWKSDLWFWRFGLRNSIFDLEIWWVFSFYMRFRFGLQSLIRVYHDTAIYQPYVIVPCHAQGRGDISMVVYNEQGQFWLYSRIRRRWSILY